MKAHPNWSARGYVITHDELEAADHEHALREAVDYFRANDPERLAEILKD